MDHGLSYCMPTSGPTSPHSVLQWNLCESIEHTRWLFKFSRNLMMDYANMCLRIAPGDVKRALNWYFRGRAPIGAHQIAWYKVRNRKPALGDRRMGWGYLFLFLCDLWRNLLWSLPNRGLVRPFQKVFGWWFRSDWGGGGLSSTKRWPRQKY